MATDISLLMGEISDESSVQTSDERKILVEGLLAALLKEQEEKYS